MTMVEAVQTSTAVTPLVGLVDYMNISEHV